MKTGIVTMRSRLERMTASEKLAAYRRLDQIVSGEIRVPPRCGHCGATTLYPDLESRAVVKCGACGKMSDADAVHRARQLEIQAVVIGGVVD
jgi:hypothetical protein